MRSRTTALALMTLFTAGLLLAACDDEEQGRILRYQKGTYMGQSDTPLDDATLEELRYRARQQAGG